MNNFNEDIEPEEVQKLATTFFKDIPFNQGLAFVIHELVPNCFEHS